MRYVVTGGTGFVGGRVTEQLLDAGHDVVVLARTPSKTAGLREAGASIVKGDITKKSSMREPIEGSDGVFHVAGWYELGTGDPEQGERVNVDGTRNVLELVAELGIEKAVYTSTLAVNSDTDGVVVDESYRYHGPHITDYDRTKWEAHYEVVEPMSEDGVPIVTVLPGAVYGPGDTSQLGEIWARYLRGDLPAIPRKTAYCWGHVDDIARGHLLAMDHGEPGEAYIVAGEPATLVEAFEMAEEITGVPIPRSVSPKLFGAMALGARLVEPLVDLPPSYHPETLRTLAGVTYLGDNAKATRELGLDHRPLRDGLRDVLESERDDLQASGVGVVPFQSA